MLDALFNVTVRLMRRKVEGVKAETVFEEALTTNGGPLPIKCRFERRRRRIYRKDGPELEVDGTVLCRKLKAGEPTIAAEDVLVREDSGEAFKVVTVDEDQQLFSGLKYLRMTVQATKLAVPARVDE